MVPVAAAMGKRTSTKYTFPHTYKKVVLQCVCLFKKIGGKVCFSGTFQLEKKFLGHLNMPQHHEEALKSSARAWRSVQGQCSLGKPSEMRARRPQLSSCN